ncbi:MAG: radical SAM protein [Deltaproteobacteria bacterium]|nr:radical SAM protein [Deltaproteobacteria bacterium]
MKVLLIYPYCLEARLSAEDVRVPPIGIYYVGALLKSRHYDVEILNWYDARNDPGRIRATLTAKQPDVIGFSVLHANRWGAIEIARTAKALNPEVKIVFGGIGATFLWAHFLTHFCEVDVCVLGEGEIPFLKLMDAFSKGEEATLEGIEGIAYRAGDRVTRTRAPAPIRDIDALPNPATYFTYPHVASSRGCPNNCTFCGSPRFWGRRVRFHSPAYFVEQLEMLYEKGVRFFYISDDTFTLKKDRVIEICKMILSRGLAISWAAISRVNLVDQEILYWMRRAGCTQISYGVESGSEKIRRHLNKGISNRQIREAFSLTRKMGILARAYFIYGSPEENWETIDETVQMIEDIQPLSAIFYILDIFPGTALYQDFLKRSGLTDDIWLNQGEDIMYFETDPALSEAMILAFGRKLRDTFYTLLPRFVSSLSLVDQEALYPLHADFLSRLGMTFSQGDYAQIEAIPDKPAIAEDLYRRSLAYAPNHRAYLGLGIIKQQQGDFAASVDVLSEGAARYPDSEELHLCLGISLMNLGQWDQALKAFSRFPHSERMKPYMSECQKTFRKP